jgi:hypothetical protein
MYGPLHLTAWFFWPKAKEYRRENDHFVPGGGGGGEVGFTDVFHGRTEHEAQLVF